MKCWNGPIIQFGLSPNPPWSPRYRFLSRMAEGGGGSGEGGLVVTTNGQEAVAAMEP